MRGKFRHGTLGCRPLGVVMWMVMASFPLFAQSFTMSEFSLDISTAYAVVAADLDGDADMDAAATGRSTGLVAWIENQGQSTVTHPIHFFAGGVRGITAADFDSDGDTDLMVAAYGENRIVMFRNNGGGGPEHFVAVTVYSSSSGAYAVRACDFDGDGDADLVATDYRGNVARLFLQQNDTLQLAYAVSVRAGFDIEAVDYEGDADQDILVQSETDGIVWIEQVAPLNFVPHVLGIGFGQISFEAIDLDGDSDLDLVASAFYDNRVIWWERGPQGFTSRPLNGAMPHPRAVGVADFNEDGALDIIAISQEGTVAWWRRSGSGFVYEALPPGSGPHGLCVVDYDRDGDFDVLVADYWASSVTLYRNSMGIPSVIRGTVRGHASGGPISGARVRLIENGVQVMTDGAGRFAASTRAGTYTVEVTHPCWNSGRLEGVELDAGDTSTVDLSLLRPGIEVGVTSLNLIVPNRERRTVQIPIRNPGDGVLQIIATASGSEGDRDWLGVTPAQMTVSPGDSGFFEVFVSPDTSDAMNWDYYGEIWLRANVCPDSVLRVAVLVYVTALEAHSPGSFGPAQVALHSAYPNPFNSYTRIAFDLDHLQPVTLAVYNITGALATTLLSETRAAGRYEVIFDATNMSSGVYLISLETPSMNVMEKVFLIK